MLVAWPSNKNPSNNTVKLITWSDIIHENQDKTESNKIQNKIQNKIKIKIDTKDKEKNKKSSNENNNNLLHNIFFIYHTFIISF